MKLRAIHRYVALMAAAAILLFSLQDWAAVQSLTASEIVGLLGLAVLGVASEAVSIRLSIGRQASESSLTFIPVLSTVLLFGPSLGLALAVAIISFSQFLLHKKPPIRSIFNICQWTVACGLSGLAYSTVGNLVGLPSPSYPQAMDSGWLLAPFSVFVISFLTLNYISVAGAISLDSGTSFLRVLRTILGSAGANVAYGILISPIAFVVAVLYLQFEFRPIGISVALLPLIFVRMSYLTNIKLQAANRDLLKALVKAIETRDPYTSGHSLRVSALAGRIARSLGMSQRRVDQVEMAALLHDIGKIDAVYVGILKKPDKLSAEERAVIESHVTKGVELLESLSSFPPAVVAAVRHHHEREDGKGYPDGLTGDDIPIGAKIIKVCDAVDAMLSDRPYRAALDLPKVREQLITYAGTQFDVVVVSAAIKEDTLERHRNEVAASKEWSPLNILDQHEVSTEGSGADLRATVKTALSAMPIAKKRPRRPPTPFAHE